MEDVSREIKDAVTYLRVSGILLNANGILVSMSGENKKNIYMTI